MAKQLNVNLSVKADTKQAQEALNTLGRALHEIQNIKNMPIVADESYKSAANAAKQLERNLQAAVNVDTGKLDLNKFSMSLKKSNTSLTELAVKLNGAGTTGQQAFLNLAKSIALADNSALNLGTKIGGLMTTLKNTARWQISSSILHGFMGTIQSAYGYAQDLNESLNNIRIVTGQSTDQMAAFAKQANEAAKALSTTTTKYTDAALIYYQQGLSGKEVTERVNTTIKLANVSRQSAEEVSSQMTAIWNNFDDGSKSLEYYSDVINKLGAATASSSDEIAQGLQKFASVADTVGLSYEKATAALATVVAETRQSADVVGTAFKTMFARFQGLQLGETLEDGVTLNKYSEALSVIGVNILDANGNLRIMDDILDDTAKKWDTITEAQQVALAETVAGTRQYAQFMAIMENYDKILANQNLAAGAEGTLQKQADIYAESWEAASKRVRAALEEIYSDLLNDKFFIGLLNFAEKVVGAISEITKGLGGVKGLVLLIGSIFMNTYAKEMPRVFDTISQNLLIIAGQGEKIKSSMLKEISAGLELNKNSIIGLASGQNNEMQAKYQSTQKAIEMTQKLNASLKTLSQTEIEEYQAKIQQTIQEGEYLAELGKELDTLEKLANEQSLRAANGAMASYNNATSSITGEKMSDDEVAGDTYEEAINKLLNERNKIYKNIQKAKAESLSATFTEKDKSEYIRLEKEKQKQLEEKIAALRSSESKTLEFINGEYKQAVANERILSDESEKIVTRTKNWEEAEAKIQQLLSGNNREREAGVRLTNDLAQQMSNYADYLLKTFAETNGGVLPAGAEEEINRFRQAIQAAREDSSKWDEVFRMLNDGGSVFSLLAERSLEAQNALAGVEQKGEDLGIIFDSDPMQKMSKSMGDAAIKAHNLKDGLDGLGQKMLDNQSHTLSLSEGLSKIGSTAMQVSMAINGIKRLGSIWSDDNLSDGEKMLQTLTSLGTILPAITALTNTQRLAELSATAAKLLHMKAVNADKTAEGLSIPIKIASGEAGYFALGPLLIFVAIAGAVVAAIVLIAKNIETQTEKLKRLKKEQEELNQLVE